MSNHIEFSYYDYDLDEDVSIDLPAVWEICGVCSGNGSYVNKSIDGNGITHEEWVRDWDDEERQHYFRGAYDVTCTTCNGNGKILVYDMENIAPEIVELIETQERLDDYHDYERESERRFGC